MISLRSAHRMKVSATKSDMYLHLGYYKPQTLCTRTWPSSTFGQKPIIYIIYNRLVTTTSSFIYIHLVNIILCSSSTLPLCVTEGVSTATHNVYVSNNSP